MDGDYLITEVLYNTILLFELLTESNFNGPLILLIFLSFFLFSFYFGFSDGTSINCDCQDLAQWVKQVLFENLLEAACGSWYNRKQLKGWLPCPSSQTQRKASPTKRGSGLYRLTSAPQKAPLTNWFSTELLGLPNGPFS